MKKRPQKNHKRVWHRHKVQPDKKKVLAGALLLIAVLFLYHPLKNFAVSKMVRFGTAEWKVLEQSTQEEALIIREENVITAPSDGTFETVAADNVKVAVGQIIGYIKTRGAAAQADALKIPVKAPKAGLLSYHTDGLEDVLKPDLLNNLHIDKIASIIFQQQKETVHLPQTAQGKPICKIVDNLVNPYFYIETDHQNLERFVEKGEKISVRFPNGLASQVVVQEVKKSDHKFIILVKALNAPDLDLTTRELPIELIFDSYEGVVISKNALVKENDEDGVFISREKVCVWKKVEIMGSIGNETVVSGLEVGEQYIINPSFIKKGQIIN